MGKKEITSREKKQILKARARVLAREPQSVKAEKNDVPSLHAVEFLLTRERYAIESKYVRQVYPLKNLTPLPCTPPFVMGITNVRGRIVSVIDIKKLFDLPGQGLSDLNKLIIVHMDGLELGILSDNILGTRSVPIEEIQPSLSTFTGVRAEYLRGVTDEGLIILDAKKILSDERIIVHEKVQI